MERQPSAAVRVASVLAQRLRGVRKVQVGLTIRSEEEVNLRARVRMATARIPDERVGGSDAARATASQGRAGNGSAVRACRRTAAAGARPPRASPPMMTAIAMGTDRQGR